MANAKSKSTSSAHVAHVALFRGINVGGKNLVPMKGLSALFADAGCRDVSSYIQSGNVVFQASSKTLPGLSSRIALAVKKAYDVDSPVIVRSADELAAVVAENPFLKEGAEPSALHVAFLADEPAAAAVAALDPNRSPGDSFVARGAHVYLHCPNGFARTKLTNLFFDSKLKTTSTIRNWNTVLKLRELTSAKG